MKQFIQKMLLVFMTAMTGITTNAHDCIVDGIYYNLDMNTGTASVTYKGTITGQGISTKYELDTTYYKNYISIPETISYEGTSYKVVSIGRYSFYKSSLLNRVTIPKNIKEIGSSAFEGCTNLTTVIIEEGELESILNTAFRDCISLNNIVLPSSLKRIGSYAFNNCYSLNTIVIPDNVVQMGDYTFYNCVNLEYVTVGKSLAQDYIRSIFVGCTALKSFNVQPENTTYSSVDGALFNKDVTKMVLCPEGKTGEYVIPSTVTTIGYGALNNCRCLTGITIPASVISIEGTMDEYEQKTTNPFQGCTSLASIVIGQGNPVFDSRDGANAIIASSTNELIVGCKNTTIPNSVTSIGASAFSGCSGLVSISIPSSVTTIKGLAFYDCTGLTSISIPASVTTIGVNAFYGCTELTDVSLPNSVTNIDGRAFYRCTSLSSPVYNSHIFVYMPTSYIGPYVIPAGISSVADYAFSSCEGLSSVTIPNTVTYIGNSAFYGCSSLKKLTIPNSVTSIGSSAFYECSSLTSVAIPNSVTSIGKMAFEYCSALSSVMIPNSITFIERSTFAYCSALTSVVIPNSVIRIEEQAFNGCSNMKDIFNYAETAQDISYYTFSNYSATLHVLKGCKNAYAYNAKWTNFKNIVDDLEPTTTGICGEKVFYTFDSSTGVLTITGSGAMENYTTRSPSPWFSYRNTIKTVVITEGITSVGDYAFYDCSNLTLVSLPSDSKTLQFIGDRAFKDCTSLKKIILYYCTYHSSAFAGCNLDLIVSYKSDGGSMIIDGKNYKFGISYDYYYTRPDSMNYLERDFRWPLIGQKGAMISLYKSNEYLDNVHSLKEVSINGFTLTPENEDENHFYYFISGLERNTPFEVKQIYVNDGQEYILTCSFNTLSGKPWIDHGGGKNYRTPTTITFRPHNILFSTQLYDDPTCKVVEYGVEFEGTEYAVNENWQVFRGLKPRSIYYFKPYIIYEDGMKYYGDSKAVETESIEMTFGDTDAKPTSISGLGYTINDKEASWIEVYLGNTKYDISEESPLFIHGLEPNSSYSLTNVFRINSKETYSVMSSAKTTELVLITLTPKVTNKGEAIVCATTNIVDDETNVGFEWRKIDAPDIVPSKIGAAAIYDGTMEGMIKNLDASTYWKVRPYYESAAGNKYYGEWVGFDPSDFSYFEPTVHTYANAVVTEGAAVLTGYVMAGSDAIEEQGFEYWLANMGNSRSNRAPSSGIQRVTGTGQRMVVQLSDLQAGTTYTYRAFVKTSRGTTYGEEMTFTTKENITDVVETVTSDETNLKIIGYYNLQGRKLSKPENGKLNIIRYADGTTKKVIIAP